MSDSRQIGVYSALEINGETKPMRNMLKEASQRYPSVLDRSKLSVTLTEPAETLIDVVIDVDEAALRHVSRNVLDILGRVPLSAIVLKPQEQRLRQYGNFLAVPLVKCEVIRYLREEIYEIYYDATLRHLSEASYKPHLSIVRSKDKSKAKRRQREHQPHIPDLHVRGFTVGQSDLTQYPHRQRSHQSYVNRSRR